jgi:hypothetical protein
MNFHNLVATWQPRVGVAARRGAGADVARELDHSAEEHVAETIAYSVCASSGIDPGVFSISYHAGRREHNPDSHDRAHRALQPTLAPQDAVASVTLARRRGSPHRPASCGGRRALTGRLFSSRPHLSKVPPHTSFPT